MSCNICKRLLGFMIGIDEALDGAAGYNPHTTISQQLGWARQRGSKVAAFFCKILNILFFTKDHCGEAIKDFPENLPTDG
ncbi:MAG: hypothetical protein KGL39_11770 [Patescibacteria group bacterium]|nr:hypothetical protein [Patescibacteria group bacterium]